MSGDVQTVPTEEAMALCLAEMLVETFDWAWSLCGEREGLDELRDRAKGLLEVYAAGRATLPPELELFLKSMREEEQPWRAPGVERSVDEMSPEQRADMFGTDPIDEANADADHDAGVRLRLTEADVDQFFNPDGDGEP